MLKDLPTPLDQQPTVSDEKLHWNVMLEEKNWPQNIVEMIEKDTNHKTDGFSPWSIPIFPFLSFLVATSAIRLKRAFQCFSLSNYLLMKPFLASLHCLLQLVHWRGWCSSAKQNQLLTPSSLRLLRLLHSAGKNVNLCLKHNWSFWQAGLTLTWTIPLSVTTYDILFPFSFAFFFPFINCWKDQIWNRIDSKYVFKLTSSSSFFFLSLTFWASLASMVFGFLSFSSSS